MRFYSQLWQASRSSSGNLTSCCWHKAGYCPAHSVGFFSSLLFADADKMKQTDSIQRRPFCFFDCSHNSVKWHHRCHLLVWTVSGSVLKLSHVTPATCQTKPNATNFLPRLFKNGVWLSFKLSCCLCNGKYRIQSFWRFSKKWLILNIVDSLKKISF